MNAHHLLFWMRWGGALTAAAAGLAIVSLPGPAARAAGPSYDQMTGVGLTASAVTVPWTQGLLDTNNTPIASANADRSSSSPTSPLSFMYKDFQGLQVTVSQTQDISHQGITVTWTGGEQTAQFGTVQANFLQMMECYGDATSGPTPEQCEYGSAGLLPGGVANPAIGERTGPICVANSVPNTQNPPKDQNGSVVTGCDTQEPSDPTHNGPCPGVYCDPTTFRIPFAPVSDPTNPVYDPGTTYYNEFNTDEVQEAITAPGGTGQQQFETLTGVQAPGLGCGQPDSGNNNQPRGCWLVIVPRGQFEPNGYPININNANSSIDTSPLSASNWAQRIQIHLGFAPVQAFCPIGTLERQTIGTQLISRAMQSWQLALNQAANCNKIYGFSAVPEATSTQQLSDPTSGVGLAFTSIPIGSEATREPGGSPPANLPSILYAPVAVSALDFGFNINEGTGYITTPVKLTPLLLAKALTQSYRQDLPDYYPDVSGHSGPTWSQSNPLNISTDPQFTALNQPPVPSDPTGPIAPLVTEDHSGPNQQFWQWIQADSTASSWLGGTPDSSDNNMPVDPAYQALNLGKGTALDSFPRAYSTCLDLGQYPGPPPKEETKCSLDLLPYTDNYDSAAAAVLSANNPDETGSFSNIYQAPDGTDGWWGKAGVEPLGQVFMWTADDTSNLAAYGLVPAQLCNESGNTCVSPSTDSVTAALNAATPDSSGLLHVDPANPGTGGYPLVDVTYAAVSTNQSGTALSDYADLIAYAAGAGQTVGSVAGDLPPGYLPLPAKLQAQAQAVVAQLRSLASPSPSPSPTTATTTSSGAVLGGESTQPGTAGGATTSGDTTGGVSTGGGATSSATSGATSGGPTTGATKAGATPAPAAGSTPTPSGSHPAPARATTTAPSGSPITSLPAAQQAASTTPRQVVGIIRWVLIGVLVAGGGCAGGGTLLSYGWTLPWLWPRRPG